MKKINSLKGCILALTFLSVIPVFSVTKKKILYLAGTTPATSDIQLTTRLSGTYDLTILTMTATTVSEIAQSSNANYAKNFAAIYLSESVGTSSMPNGLLTLDVPVVNSKFLVAPTAKWGLLTSTGSKVDIATLADAVVTMSTDNSSHPLAAGLTGDVKLVADGTTSANNIYLNALIAPVTGIIPIATVKSDATKNVVFGIETGSTLNCTNATYPMTKTTKRVANIGFHVSCINNLTESAYKLVEAAIEWTTATVTTDIILVNKDKFSLTIDGHNKFKINLNAPQNSLVSVFSLVGKLVYSTNANTVEALIDLSGQPAGIYVVKINGDKLSGAKKIVVE
ncbi:MAG: T9SS type A sorting domain-containing protein [Paludibacter sp.]